MVRDRSKTKAKSVDEFIDQGADDHGNTTPPVATGYRAPRTGGPSRQLLIKFDSDTLPLELEATASRFYASKAAVARRALELGLAQLQNHDRLDAEH